MKTYYTNSLIYLYIKVEAFITNHFKTAFNNYSYKIHKLHKTKLI